MSRANLSEAVLAGANLLKTDLSESELTSAALRKAIMSGGEKVSRFAGLTIWALASGFSVVFPRRTKGSPDSHHGQ